MSITDEEPGHGLKRGLGRPPNSPNKFSHQLRQAMLDACLLTDEAKDPEHPELPPSLTRFMFNMQKQWPLAYFKAIARLCPQEIKTQSQSTIEIYNETYHNVEEVKAALIASGLTEREVRQLESMFLPENEKPKMLSENKKPVLEEP